MIAVIGGALTVVYFTKSTLLEGKIQDLLGVFNMAGHMDNFVNGILDIGGVVLLPVRHCNLHFPCNTVPAQKTLE